MCGIGAGLWFCLENPMACIPGGSGGGGGGGGDGIDPRTEPPIDWDTPPANDNQPPTNFDDMCWDWYFEDLEKCGEHLAETNDELAWVRCRNQAEVDLENCRNTLGGISARYTNASQPYVRMPHTSLLE